MENLEQTKSLRELKPGLSLKEKAKLNKNVTLAYFGFLFQTFFKRPFGYIIPLLYIVYFGLILVLVPLVTHSGPLAIWNMPAFNMQIFNLFFIAAIAAAIAVILFKIGEEDGTELCLSAKPITKRRRVLIKTFTYIFLMLIINAVTILVVASIWPIFGEFHILKNPTGITVREYVALLLSIFMGNVVNTLLFGGLAVFISLVGNQILTMVGTIGIAFVLCLMNFIYPIAVGKPKSILKDSFNTSINSISANTLSQIEGKDTSSEKVKTWAAIQALTEDTGEEVNHMDTYEYLTKAERMAGITITNYFDFGKQLSSLFVSFGLDESKKTNVEHSSIGSNSSYKYTINPSTCAASNENREKENYPVAIYSLLSKQGISYPIVNILGGNTALDVDNWTILSKLTDSDFNSLFILSKDYNLMLSNKIFRQYVGTPFYTLSSLNTIRNQRNASYNDAYKAARYLFYIYTTKINDKGEKSSTWDTSNYRKSYNSSETSCEYIISLANNYEEQEIKSGIFFDKDKTWEDLDQSPKEKSYAISNILLYWAVCASSWQQYWIEDFKAQPKPDNLTDKQWELIKADTYPYSSLTVKSWYENYIKNQQGEIKDIQLYNIQALIEQIFHVGVHAGRYQLTADVDPVDYYVYPINSQFEYCETFNNLYQFTIKPYFNVYIVTGIWTGLAIFLFLISIAIYRKIDFK